MNTEMNRTGASQFIALERALQIIESLGDVIGPIRRRGVELAQQILRSANSIAANLSKGRRRQGGDRLHLFRIAAGSAEETRTHLRVAVAWGWIRPCDIDTSLDLIDQVRAITWRLTH
jgi:four helix bundle protein